MTSMWVSPQRPLHHTPKTHAKPWMLLFCAWHTRCGTPWDVHPWVTGENVAHTMELCSTLKRNEVVNFVGKWTELEIKRNKTERQTSCFLSNEESRFKFVSIHVYMHSRTVESLSREAVERADEGGMSKPKARGGTGRQKWTKCNDVPAWQCHGQWCTCVWTQLLEVESGGSGVQGLSRLYSKFEVSLSYMKPCSNKWTEEPVSLYANKWKEGGRKGRRTLTFFFNKRQPLCFIFRFYTWKRNQQKRMEEAF